MEQRILIAAASTDAYVLGDVHHDLDLRVRLLRLLTDEAALVWPLGQAPYEALIDNALLRSISTIQGGVIIPDDSASECIDLLRLSPTALGWALRPDNMIVAHRRDQVTADIERNDHRYVRLQLLRLAVTDFQHSGPAKVYLERFGLRELEYVRVARFKTAERTVREVSVAERHGIAHVAGSSAGAVVRVWLYDKAPEPWDHQAFSDTTNEATADGPVKDGDAPADAGEEASR